MNPQAAVRALLGLAAAAALAAYDPFGLDAYTDAKLTAWSALLCAACAVWASGAAHRPVPVRLDAAVVLALVTAAGVSMTSLDRTLSLFGPAHLRGDGLLPLLSLAAGYWAARSSGLGDAPKPLFLGLAGAAFVLGAGAVFERAGLPPMPGLPTGLTDGRANSVSGSPVYLGASLALCLPAVLDLARSERGRLRAFAAAAGAACAAGLWLSRSRGAWVSAAAGAACWAALSSGTLSPRLRRAAFAGAAVALLLLPALFLLRGSRAASDAGRLEVWRTSLRLARERPVTGWGPGTLELALQLRADEGFLRAYGREHTQASAHNDFLHAAAVGGAPGLLSLLALWTALVLASRAALAAGLSGTPAAAGALAALFIQAKVSPLPFGALAAGGLYAACLVPHKKAGGAGRSAWVPALALLGLTFVGGRGMAADRAHRHALEAQNAGRFPEMERSLKMAFQLDRSNASPAFERVLLLVKTARAAAPAQQGRFAEAAVLAARDLVDNRPAAAAGWHALGLALAERAGPGDREEAVRCLDQALSRDWRRPGLSEARARLSEILK
ncbi:MAG: O-antigen ligase family protein [Elusimicrobia bacterium]|nr:O-antigen ligase family protein [Elusimicrobiota bacterium]